ncbi:MAG: hypothetical protein PHE83_14470, partial [Opitutaceae bacterium]|nr:hypothetical protein [Opitutaceae bacterium]
MTMPTHLVAELHDAVGAQSPAGGAVLLHVAALAAGDQQNGRTHQPRARVGQADGREDEHRHHECAGNGIPVRDAEGDAVDEDKEENEPDAHRQIAQGLAQHRMANDRDRHPPEADPQHQPKNVHALPVLAKPGRRFIFPAQPADGLKQNHADIQERGPEDGAERDDEADLAEGRAGLDPADAGQIGPQPGADEGDHERGQRDARSDDHAGAKGGGGQADGPDHRQLQRSQSAQIPAQDAAPELGHGLLQEILVRERAENVRHRQTGRKSQLHP